MMIDIHHPQLDWPPFLRDQGGFHSLILGSIQRDLHQANSLGMVEFPLPPTFEYRMVFEDTLW